MSKIASDSIITIIKKNVLTVPGVDKKKPVTVRYIEEGFADIQFSPLSYVSNISEISKRIQSVLGKILKEKIGFNIILNVRSSL
ncbi:MAG: hypothetical protein LBB95_01425 [Mycoplasmataceae bacterium]|jgi:hypothetical protein|nr:hypothetical protein [Mycoplasmataceae bacterium]